MKFLLVNTILIVISLLLSSFRYVNTSQCTIEKLMYTFTECDQFGGRWRVLVPKNTSNCTFNYVESSVTNITAPQTNLTSLSRVEGCLNSCEPGYYFNNTVLSCEICQPGYFSLGDGRQFNLFDDEMIRKNFQITSETLNGADNSVAKFV